MVLKSLAKQAAEEKQQKAANPGIKSIHVITWREGSRDLANIYWKYQKQNKQFETVAFTLAALWPLLHNCSQGLSVPLHK